MLNPKFHHHKDSKLIYLLGRCRNRYIAGDNEALDEAQEISDELEARKEFRIKAARITRRNGKGRLFGERFSLF